MTFKKYVPYGFAVWDVLYYAYYDRIAMLKGSAKEHKTKQRSYTEIAESNSIKPNVKLQKTLHKNAKSGGKYMLKNA